MAEMIPMHVLERLEREWRLIESERDTDKPSSKQEPKQETTKRPKVGRAG